MRSKARRLAVCVALAVVACEPGGAAVGAGQSADPDRMLANGMTARQVIEARALHMKDLGGSYKAVRDQLQNEKPNLNLIRIAVQEVKYASDDLPGWFPQGTGPETGVEMRSFVQVWSDPEGFVSASREFREAAAALQAAAQDTNLDEIRTRVRAVGRTCESCHDAYRAEED